MILGNLLTLSDPQRAVGKINKVIFLVYNFSLLVQFPHLQAPLSFTIFHSLLKLMSIESVMPSNHLILCCLLLLLSIFPSTRVFFNEWTLCIRWLKYWRFSFTISPFYEYSGLISFRIDWFDLLAFKELSRVFSSTTVWKYQFFGSQHFFMVWLSFLYVTSGNTIALSTQTFVDKVMSLLFNVWQVIFTYTLAVLTGGKEGDLACLYHPQDIWPCLKMFLVVITLQLFLPGKFHGQRSLAGYSP